MCKTTIQLREVDRNWLESWKRRLKLKTNGEVISKLKKLISKLKLHEELEGLKK